MSSKKKDIISCIVGNALEWFDYGLYSTFAPIIGNLFFPQSSVFASTLYAYLVFAVGFIARPFGGIVIGYIGDKYGRKKALLISIMLMSIPTSIIGVMPTYESIGMLAPIGLVLVRLAQGVAIGGEFTSSITYLAEKAEPNKRGLNSSWADFGSPLGILMGTIVSIIVSGYMEESAFQQYGWRVPFIASIFITIFALYIRKNMTESEEFKKIKNTTNKESIKSYIPSIFNAVFVGSFSAVCFYIILTFIPNQMYNDKILTSHDVFLYNSLVNIFMIIAIPIAGYMSDIVGRKPVLFTGIIISMIFGYFMLQFYNNLNVSIIFQIFFSIGIGIYFGGRGAFYAESFPTAIRCRAISLSMGISHSLFAGMTPLAAAFIKEKYDILSVYYMIVVFCIISCLGVYRMKLKD